MFGAGLVTFLLSKEIWIVEHGFAEFATFWAAIIIVNKKFGAQLGNYFDKTTDVSICLQFYYQLSI